MIHLQDTLNLRGHLLTLDRPVVMGILNVTPDSFYDGGRHVQSDAILRQVEGMLQEGARLIDIGGMSSRPGSEAVPVSVELHRVMPVIERVFERFPEVLISVDTYRSEVASKALERGVHMINDISAGRLDEKLLDVVSEYAVPYVLMHMQGRPKDMQDDPQYGDVAADVLRFFIGQLENLKQAGIHDVILDPGFGFGKSVEHNYTLLAKLGIFKFLERPLMVGLSRKSMICKVLKINPEKALNGSSALHMLALLNGARILRVHDVREAVEVIRLYEQYQAVMR